jgi:DNA-binding CsgD family transcriptional regulator
MLLTEARFGLVRNLERQTDIPSLLTSFQRFVASFGMCAFCIGTPVNARTRKGRRWEGTFSEEIYRYYALNFIGADPIIARMKADPSPFRWADTYERSSPAERRTMALLSELGHPDGLAVPIHGRHGVVAGVSIGTDKYELSPQDETTLHLASLYLHARMRALQFAGWSQPSRGLTPRERECLEWVAAGKTDWEISQILSISEQTVHGYVQNAMTKLGARTRAQAVALAIQSSQIQP